MSRKLGDSCSARRRWGDGRRFHVNPPLEADLSRRHAILICSAVIAFGSSSANADVFSGFDSSLEGWTSNTPAEVVWQASGGNPGGYAQFTDMSPSATVIYAPTSFLGDWIAEKVSSISFEQNVIAENNVISVSPYEIDISGPGGAATWTGGTPSVATLPTGWVESAAAVASGTPPSGWSVTSGTWNGLLANVTSLDLGIEAVTNNQVPGWVDVEGIDNVNLTTAVPEPSIWAMLILGFGMIGWMTRLRAGRSSLAV